MNDVTPVIVVIGSVKPEQYQETRFECLRRGLSPRIKHIADGTLESVISMDEFSEREYPLEDQDDDAEEVDPLRLSYAKDTVADLERFCRFHELDPQAVVAVVVNSKDWYGIVTESTSHENAFDTHFTDFWVNLPFVTIISPSGQAEKI